LGVTLDESLEDEDEVLVVDGIEVVIDRVLHKRLGDVTIDYSPETGVVVRSCASCGKPA
jgi:Fe-S cluster assembly iron-binding protein IscA